MAKLSKCEREAVCAVIDFVLAGEIVETIFSERDIDALKRAINKLTDAYREPSVTK